MIGTALARATGLVASALHGASGPVVVALDGRSGVGKSTLAGQLAARFDGQVIEGDDFYAGGTGILGDPPAARAARCIDWQEQRRVLGLLKRGKAAAWHAFDWEAFDGSRCEQATTVGPARLVILEGTYSARPELADLTDLRLLLRVPDTLRLARLMAREGGIGPWETQWHEAEDWYFAQAAPADQFDLVLDGDG